MRLSRHAMLQQVSKGKYTLISDITVSGSAVTQVDFNGLSLDKDSEYSLTCDIYSTANANMFLNVNGISGAPNYNTQYLGVYGTSMEGLRYTTPIIAYIQGPTYTTTLAIVKIKLTNSGYFAYQADGTAYYTNSGSMQIRNYLGASVATMASITTLSVVSSVAGGIGIGSRFQLYKTGGA